MPVKMCKLDLALCSSGAQYAGWGDINEEGETQWFRRETAHATDGK